MSTDVMKTGWIIEVCWGFGTVWTTLGTDVYETKELAEGIVQSMRHIAAAPDCPPQYIAYRDIPLRVSPTPVEPKDTVAGVEKPLCECEHKESQHWPLFESKYLGRFRRCSELGCDCTEYGPKEAALEAARPVLRMTSEEFQCLSQEHKQAIADAEIRVVSPELATEVSPETIAITEDFNVPEEFRQWYKSIYPVAYNAGFKHWQYALAAWNYLKSPKPEPATAGASETIDEDENLTDEVCPNCGEVGVGYGAFCHNIGLPWPEPKAEGASIQVDMTSYSLGFKACQQMTKTHPHLFVQQAEGAEKVSPIAGINGNYVLLEDYQKLESRNAELTEQLSHYPAVWREDSSLKTWFPLTAEELERTKDELKTITERMRKFDPLISAMEKEGVQTVSGAAMDHVEHLRFDNWYARNRAQLYQLQEERMRMAIKDTARAAWIEGQGRYAAELDRLRFENRNLTAADDQQRKDHYVMVPDRKQQAPVLGVFDISRLQGELEFSVAMALRNISEAVAAGIVDVKLEGFHPGVSSDPKDSRAHVKVQLRISAPIRKDISSAVETPEDDPDGYMYRDSYLPHSAPPREPVRLYRQLCSDCVDGRCDMNCGPAVPSTEKK